MRGIFKRFLISTYHHTATPVVPRWRSESGRFSVKSEPPPHSLVVLHYNLRTCYARERTNHEFRSTLKISLPPLVIILDKMTPSISTTQLSYTVDGLLAAVPNRLDGRSFLAFRTLQLSTGVAPQAAGSAKCILGEGSTTTCTAVVSADVVQDEEASGSLLACTVDW